MAASKEPTIVLPSSTTNSGSPVRWPGFPGVWTPDVPVECSAVGLDDEAARALIDELGLPLQVSSPFSKPKPEKAEEEEKAEEG